MNDMLTNEDLIELTGYKYPSKQCEVLQRSCISFVVRRDGRPRVTWTHVNAVLNGSPTSTPTDHEEQPNFEGI